MPDPAFKPRVESILRWALLAVAAAFFVLHFLHLNADFPNHSPWVDWAKYTDEGWYSDAATRHFQRGHWYLPGDFNPGVVVPIWPLMESLPFALFGASMAVARACAVATFGLVCAASWLLLYRWRDEESSEPRSRSFAPELAVLLLNVSPFCYVFFRLAVLEPPLVLLVLIALLAASAAGRGRLWLLIVLGVLMPVAVLTKTTAVAVFPAIGYLLWRCTGGTKDSAGRKAFLHAVAIAGTVAVILAAVYTFAVDHFRLADDARNIFAANGGHIHRSSAAPALLNALEDFRWAGLLGIPLCVGVVAALFRARRNPVVPTLLLWAGGYFGFIVYHAYRQPRYYLAIIVPLVLLLAHVAARPFVGLASSASKSRKLLAAATAVAMLGVITLEGRRTIGYVLHPDYTYLNAALQIRAAIAAEPGRSALVLSGSGSDLSLYTGLPSIGDTFTLLPTRPLAELYEPGWLALYSPREDAKRDELETYFHLQEVGRFYIMDEPEFKALVLYRLRPMTVPHR